jgi:hypothetical protein|tara:strand:- start:920 stop:1354 length:435 start_codon:yes stop_codon:yes gene_type:complete
MKFTELQKLGKEALPIERVVTDEERSNGSRFTENTDWGSDRQIKAESLFYKEVRIFLPESEFEKIESYGEKAMPDENVNYGIKLAAHETLRLENLTFNVAGVNWNCYLTANDGQDVLEEWVDERPEIVAAFDCLAHGETFPYDQ